MNISRRGVITGIGIINSCAEGVNDFLTSLKEGRSKIGDVEFLDVSQYPSKKAGEVKTVKTLEYLDKARIARYGRASIFGLAAARMAMEDANMVTGYYDPTRVSLVIGSVLGDAQFFEAGQRGKGPRDIAFDQIPHYHPAINIAGYFDINGRNLTLFGACASGNYALGCALDLIRTGRTDCALCGAADALSHVTFSGFNRLQIMTPDKCRPFDKGRSGMVLGEGACIFVVEEEKAAMRRGARTYCEIAGYGLTCDAYNISAPRMDGSTIMHAMELALQDSRLSAADIGHINAHGTGTIANDKVEAACYRTLFGDNIENIPVTSIKPMIGHTMGAAGAMEAAACAIAVKFGVIPPTVNYETEDPECRLNIVRGNSIIDGTLGAVMNNSFGFGGTNASLILSRSEVST